MVIASTIVSRSTCYALVFSGASFGFTDIALNNWFTRLIAEELSTAWVALSIVTEVAKLAQLAQLTELAQLAKLAGYCLLAS